MCTRVGITGTPVLSRREVGHTVHPLLFCTFLLIIQLGRASSAVHKRLSRHFETEAP